MPIGDVTKGARPLTSVELLDAAVWREIGTEDPQPPAAFIEALSRLVGRWLLVRSETPDMDAITLICKARGVHRERRCGTIECWVGLGDVRQSTGYLREESNANGLA
jgi:hypothetical protein